MLEKRVVVLFDGTTWDLMSQVSVPTRSRKQTTYDDRSSSDWAGQTQKTPPMRRRLHLNLHQPLPEPSADSGARPVLPEDAAALARLMLRAYAGTIDDGGEGPEEAAAEVQALLSGAYGAFDFSASELIEREGNVVAATLITHFEGHPLLAFTMTDPAWKRRGLGRAGLLRSIHRLRKAGEGSLHLVVTRGNQPAEQLYESLNMTPPPPGEGAEIAKISV